MTTKMQPGFVVALAIATIAHLVVGYLYMATGLVAPLWAMVLLIAWWWALVYAGVQLVKRRSYLVLLLPVVAAATWVGVLTIGDLVLGWTA